MCSNGSPTPSSRKAEALSGIVTNTSADLYAIPARASLGQDDEAPDKQLANVPAQATAALIVRLGAIRRNYAKLRTLAKAAETAGVVKANAYGLGAGQCVHALSKEGCRTFFVATFAEAETLRALSSMQRSMCWTVCSREIARFTMSFASALFWEAWKRSRSGQTVAGAGAESCRPRSMSIQAWRALA